MSMSEHLELVSANRSFGGWHKRYRHHSRALDCEMTFAIYLPPQAETEKVPLLWWLSGLTCTDENFMQKAGAHRLAAELGIAILCPDTSPRGTDLPGEHDSYDLGSGAGFYVNATQEPWKAHYRMYDYVTEELPSVVRQHFPLNGRESISGHSMGGHGALILALRKPGHYRSVSAFSPIVNPGGARRSRPIWARIPASGPSTTPVNWWPVAPHVSRCSSTRATPMTSSMSSCVQSGSRRSVPSAITR